MSLSTPLVSAPIGVPLTVVAIDEVDRARLKKLITLGLLPGVIVRLDRRWPCYVLAVGASRFALDRTLADGIVVDSVEPS